MAPFPGPVVVSALILVNGLVSKPLRTGAGLLVVGAGIPIYWWLSHIELRRLTPWAGLEPATP